MPTEAQCPASARYLYADELYSDTGLGAMQAECIRRYLHREKDAAYYTFVHWTRQANEVVVFTWNAYADLTLPKQFDCLFRVENPRQYLLLRYELIQSASNVGGLWPLNRVEQGHKHIVVFRFGQEVPALFQLLYQAEGSLATAPPAGAFKLGFCQAADLPAITAEHERIAGLRAQCGPNWWEHDEQSNQPPG